MAVVAGRLLLVLAPLVAALAAALGAFVSAWAAVPLAAAAGAVLAWRAARRVRAGEEAVAARERLLDQLPLAVLLFDGDRVSFANPAARQLFGLDRTAGQTPQEVFGGGALADAAAQTRRQHRPVQVEANHDGRELAVRASASPSGQVAMVVTDLTEARRVEQIRRDFVTNASHELKTPAAGMQALADSLLMAVDRDPDRAHKMVERLGQEAARLSQLVRDLLDLARLEEGSTRHTREPVDVAAAVRKQVDRYASLAEERGVALHADLETRGQVLAVPTDVTLIAGNLIENAVRYNHPGGRVDVVVHAADAEVSLEVSDTGIGIPEEHQDRIFERFYRVDKARSRAVGGTGLGLSLVRNAVQRHGGAVSLASVAGQGSTFRVTFPVEGSHASTRMLGQTTREDGETSSV